MVFKGSPFGVPIHAVSGSNSIAPSHWPVTPRIGVPVTLASLTFDVERQFYQADMEINNPKKIDFSGFIPPAKKAIASSRTSS